MAERWLLSVYPRLRRLPGLQVTPAPAPMSGDATPPGAVTAASSSVRRDRAFPKSAAERERSPVSAARWRAVYDDVRRRHAAGEPIMRRISRTLGVAHGTVRRPERAPHRRQPSILDPYLEHLLARHAAGCENAHQLWREIRALGYPGRPQQVRRWLQERRREHAPTAPHQFRRALPGSPSSAAIDLPSPKQLAWLLVRPPEDLPPEDAAVIKQLSQDPEAVRVISFAQRFAALVRARTPDAAGTRSPSGRDSILMRSAGTRAG